MLLIHLFQITYIRFFIPYTGVVLDTTSFAGKAGTHIHRFTALDSGYADSDTALAAELYILWRAGPEVRIERGADRATGICSTG